MLFTPQRYAVPDRPGEPFLDAGEVAGFLAEAKNPAAAAQKHRVEQAIAQAMARQRLSLPQVAALLHAPAQQRQEVLAAAEQLKRQVYGNRMVLFAPLYVGNRCMNRCAYCSFRADNPEVVRKTLDPAELRDEVQALGEQGHRRLILVYGEHPDYSPEFIAQTVSTTYSLRDKTGGPLIRRVNINAAPMDVEGFRTVKAAGIGTYQIFQETYHPDTYAHYHRGGRKQDYHWRLTALDRAMEAGIDDVGLGVLLGLHDWRFEILSLVRHVNHLEACFGVGPHTISFPRIKASAAAVEAAAPVGDQDFIYAIAVLRLAVPYTGLILTAREPAEVRERAIRYGVSQLDGGTRLRIGGYAANTAQQGGSQFAIHDERPLSQVIDSLLDGGYLPSFCTACYRRGRTGEHFMEFSVPGFIKRFCTPNGLLTLAEYLEDHAPPQTRTKGWELIERELGALAETEAEAVREKLSQIRHGGSRDLYF